VHLKVHSFRERDFGPHTLEVRILPQLRRPALGIQFDKAKVAWIRESGVEEEKCDGHVDEVFHVLEHQQRHARRAEREVVGGNDEQIDAAETTTAQDEREAGKDEDSKASGKEYEHEVTTDEWRQMHRQHVNGDVVVGRHAIDTRSVLTAPGHLEQRLNTRVTPI